MNVNCMMQVGCFSQNLTQNSDRIPTSGVSAQPQMPVSHAITFTCIGNESNTTPLVMKGGGLFIGAPFECELYDAGGCFSQNLTQNSDGIPTSGVSAHPQMPVSHAITFICIGNESNTTPLVMKGCGLFIGAPFECELYDAGGLLLLTKSDPKLKQNTYIRSLCTPPNACISCNHLHMLWE